MGLFDERTIENLRAIFCVNLRTRRSGKYLSVDFGCQIVEEA